MPSKLTWLLPLPFLLLAGVVWPRFDGLYGQDAYAYYGYGTGVLREFLANGAPFPAFFWPPGYPLGLALLSLVAGPTPLIGQIVSLTAAALTPLFTYLLARELRPQDEWVPFVAALLVALNGQLWQSAVVVMADTTGLMFATLGMWAVARFGRTVGGRWLVLAAAAMAYALLTRWAYGLVAIPATGYALSVALSHARLRPTRAIGLLVSASVTVLLVMSPVLYAVLTGQMDPVSGRPAFTGDLGVYSWEPANVLRRQFETADGLLSYRLPNVLFYAATPALPYAFTPFVAWLIVPGLWVMLRERTPAIVWLVVGWAGIVIAFHVGAPYQNVRFSLAYLPPLAVTAAAGLAAIWSAMSRAPVATQRILRPALFVLLSIGVVTMVVSGGRRVGLFIAIKDGDRAAVRWVEDRTAPDANLICFGLTLTFQHYGRLRTYEIFHLAPSQLEGIIGEERPTYLLLDVGNVQRQWAGRSPGANYEWLRTQTKLRPLGEIGAYSLFHVGGRR